MKMYIKPEILVFKVQTSQVLAVSNPSVYPDPADQGAVYARPHNGFDLWEDDDNDY